MALQKTPLKFRPRERHIRVPLEDFRERLNKAIDLINTQILVTPPVHASRHESGGADQVDHDKLKNFDADEHVNWKNATANFLTTGTARIDGDISSGVAPGTWNFHIYRSGSNVSLVAERASGAQNYVNATATHGNFGTVNAFPLRLISGGSWRVLIDPSTGNVGINEASPGEKLDVNGKVRIQSLKTAQSHPTNYKAVYVNTDTGELYRIA